MNSLDTTKMTAVILQAVSSGIKATELTVQLAQHHPYESERYMALVQQLIEYGEIIEVEYVLPDMPYRSKSFYLPKGAKVTVPPNAKAEG